MLYFVDYAILWRDLNGKNKMQMLSVEINPQQTFLIIKKLTVAKVKSKLYLTS